MAIDDNTNYTLTGAQVKDLATEVNKKVEYVDIEATTPVPAVETAMIADGAVTSAKIDWSSVNSADRVAGAFLGRGNLNITWNTNLNNIGNIFNSSYGDGYYTFNSWSGSSAGTGQPSERANGIMLVQSTAAWNVCSQVIFTAGSIYTRRYADGGWSGWYKYAGTALS